MMGWTEDDDVLATQRFGPDVQRDFRVESAAEMEQPAEEQAAEEQTAELPATGAPVSPMVLAGLVLGLSSLVIGLARRRRLG